MQGGVTKLKYILIICIGFVIGAICGWIVKKKEDKIVFDAKEVQLNRMTRFFEITDIWLQIFEEKQSIKKYFEENNIETVAVYGIGKLGKHLVKQLQQNDIVVKYIVDNRVGFYKGIDMFKLCDRLPEVDVIIVTPILEYKVIYQTLREKVDCEIVSIEDVIYETLE